MKRILLLLALILLLVAPAAAQIRWDFPATYGNDTLIVVDGVERGAAEGRGMYYLTDLNPAEEHQIDLVNTTTGATVAAARVQTLSPLGTILFFVAIEVLLALLCLTMQDPVRVVLVGALGGTIGFYLFGLALGHGALWLVVLGIVGFQALFVVLALYNLLSDALAWW